MPKAPQDHKAKAAKKPLLDPDDPRYTIEGRRFIWHGLDDDDERTIDVTIPLRLKIGMLRSVGGMGTDLDPETMFAIIERLAPGQSELLDELDANDFVAMFTLWQAVYGEQNGASLGEASRSSS